MRKNEFKLRQKVAASRPKMSEETISRIKKGLKMGVSKKAMTIIYSVSYEDIKRIRLNA